uniref:Uncharacterized protein n=1 Tax=Timema tahoe TaxID=61484 RepID=A0A7R9FFT5_9NEOP|nr:unnamed protein product [Timema tahoe]
MGRLEEVHSYLPGKEIEKSVTWETFPYELDRDSNLNFPITEISVFYRPDDVGYTSIDGITRRFSTGVPRHVGVPLKVSRCYSSPMASLVLTDSSQLTSDSQQLGLYDTNYSTRGGGGGLSMNHRRPISQFSEQILGTLKVPSRLNHIAPKPLAESLPRTNGYQLLDYPSRALERSSYNTYNNATKLGRYRPVSKIPVARAEPASDPGAVAGITPEDMGHSARDLTFINPVVKRHSALGLGDLLDSSHELTSDQEASIHSCSSARTGGHADKGVSRYLDDLVGWFHFRGVALLRLRTIALTRP